MKARVSSIPEDLDPLIDEGLEASRIEVGVEEAGLRQ